MENSFKNWQMEIIRLWSGTDDMEAAQKEYSEVAAWCNKSGEYTIIEDGEYYRVVKIEDIEENEE